MLSCILYVVQMVRAVVHGNGPNVGGMKGLWRSLIGLGMVVPCIFVGCGGRSIMWNRCNPSDQLESAFHGSASSKDLGKLATRVRYHLMDLQMCRLV